MNALSPLFIARLITAFWIAVTASIGMAIMADIAPNRPDLMLAAALVAAGLHLFLLLMVRLAGTWY